ncbi:vWA domain-containing protein [Candidatus Pristimantibacillus sp. PTI5]|uniref:vWA domain-containing protein n=1 Tax=Candidatus Pristimantibacillus sp. PTI5 TaxID=3400422 RepID=UPI003B020285
MNDLILSQRELTENPTARVPICLVLDVSGSMTGDPIEELNRGVKLFMESIRRDDIACAAAEISMVTFGGSVQTVFEFGSIHRQTIPHLSASGKTPMGEAVETALTMLENRKRLYARVGVDYYQPWLVLMTDGAPTDNIANAAYRTTTLLDEKKLTIFPIGIGADADLNALKQFSPKRTPLRLKDLNFVDFFEWLSKSVSRVSASTPGEDVKLDKPSWVSEWETL